MSTSKSEILAEAAAKHPVISNPTATGLNVVTKEEYTELARFVFDQIVNALSKSYGPYGSMTLINRAGYRFSTKDGWRILMHLVFDHNIYYEAIHRMIFEVCEQMNDTVGDGTTTVILMANRMYKKLIDQLPKISDMDLPPREVSREFDRIVSRVSSTLKAMSNPFSTEHIRPIAMIATNENKEISDCICELYERDPEAEIQIMESNHLGVSVEKVDGLKIPVMLLDRIYVNNQSEKVCDVDNALYLVFNHKVGEKAINNIILPLELTAKHLGRRLVVIAPAYEESMLVGMWLKKATDEFRTTGTSTTILCHYKPTVMGIAGAEDLAILLDTHPIDARMVDALCDGELRRGQINGRVVIKNTNKNLDVVLGECDKAKLGYETPSFFAGLHPVTMTLDAQKEAVKAEIKALEDTMTVTEKATSMKLSNLRKRLARLELKMSVIYYGADSNFDKEMLHDTIEDGVRALESARVHGIVRGSQYDLLDACKYTYKDTNTELGRILLKAIIDGIQSMLINDLYGKSDVFRTVIVHPEVEATEDDSIEYAERLRNAKAFMKLHNNPLFGMDPCEEVNPLNMITMLPDRDLITSTETDICALKASIELLKILIAGNQLVMCNS